MTLGWDNPTADPTTTILLRHGDTRLSPEHRFSGLRDLPLSAIGTRQAQAAACRLATGALIDAVVSSPLQRAVATAAIAAGELGRRQPSMMISVKPTSGTGMASPWQKSSSDGPQPRQPGDATPSRHRRAGRASPTPLIG
jgi:phosphohistidine phosphatase SixA